MWFFILNHEIHQLRTNHCVVLVSSGYCFVFFYSFLLVCRGLLHTRNGVVVTVGTEPDETRPWHQGRNPSNKSSKLNVRHLYWFRASAQFFVFPDTRKQELFPILGRLSHDGGSRTSGNYDCAGKMAGLPLAVEPSTPGVCLHIPNTPNLYLYN